MPHAFPKHVDDPPMFLMWPIDEAMPFFVLFGIGVAFKQLLICLLLGVLSVKLFRKYKDSRPEGFVLHKLWYNGYVPSKKNGMPHPFDREFIS